MTIRTVPAGTMAQALAPLTNLNLRRTCLFDLVEMELPPVLAGQVLSSLVWRLDNSSIFLARQIYFDTYKSNIELRGIDAYNDFLSSMSDRAYSDSVLLGMTASESTAYMELLQNLYLAQYLEDRGAQLWSGFERKGFYELMANDKAKTVDTDTKRKWKARCDLEARGDTAKAEEFMALSAKKFIEREDEQLQMRRATMGAVGNIISFAQPRAEPVTFQGLPVKRQLQLIEAVESVCRQQNEFASTDRKVTYDAYIEQLGATSRLTTLLVEMRKHLADKEDGVAQTPEHRAINEMANVKREADKQAKAAKARESAAAAKAE